MVISILLKIGTVKFLKNFHIDLITKKLIFQIKKLNESNFVLIIIYILIQFKVFIYSLWKFRWSTDIQNTLLLVYWPPHGIAIDHSSIGLKRLPIQLVFIEAWLCVVLRFLHLNTSQVCTATLTITEWMCLLTNSVSVCVKVWVIWRITIRLLYQVWSTLIRQILNWSHVIIFFYYGYCQFIIGRF